MKDLGLNGGFVNGMVAARNPTLAICAEKLEGILTNRLAFINEKPEYLIASYLDVTVARFLSVDEAAKAEELLLNEARRRCNNNDPRFV